MATKRINIDDLALEQAIYEKGMSLPQASRMIGRGSTTMTEWTRMGNMPANVVPVITAILDIAPDVYVSDKPKPKSRGRDGRYIKIDGKLFESLAISKAGTLQKFGEGLNIGATTPYHWASKNYIPIKMISRIKEVYDIDLEDYKLREQVEDSGLIKNDESVNDIIILETKNPLTKDDLYQIIYAAVVAGIRAVRNE